MDFNEIDGAASVKASFHNCAHNPALAGHHVSKIMNSIRNLLLVKRNGKNCTLHAILSTMFSKYCSLAVKLRQFAFVQGHAFSS